MIFNFISGLISVLLLIHVSAKIDVEIWNVRYIKTHWTRFILRTILVIPAALLMTQKPAEFWDVIKTMILIGAIWWKLFDMEINRLKKLPLWKVGTTAWSDRAFIFIGYYSIFGKWPKGFSLEHAVLATQFKSVTDMATIAQQLAKLLTLFAALLLIMN